jgi:ABC-type Fe2+-enterobactin transport system substrate-binding protein
MKAKTLSTAVAAAVLLAYAAPVFAADATTAPTTKADCKKQADMKWDNTTKTCVKK